MNQLVESDDDVVITGMGLLSPLGLDVSTHMARLMAGESAVRVLEPLKGVDGHYWLGAAVDGFDAKQHVQPRKSIKVMCREIQLAFGSAMQACKHAGIAAGTVEPERIGTVFSGEIILSDIDDIEEIVRRIATDGVMHHARWATEAMENMYPLWMLKSLPNMAACHVGIALDARGPNNTVTTEGTSSLAAILEAVNVIRRDQADVMLVGATASRLNPSRLLQRYEEDYSQNHESASNAVRPFDANRDGTAACEVSSAIVLERRRHAIARGVPILATIQSWSSLFFSSGDKRWSGVEQASNMVLKQLLERAKVAPETVGHINAAACGCIAGDAAEARGIQAAMPNTPVVSYKGAFGEAISAAGLVEYISSLAGLLNGKVAPTTNHQQTAGDCPIQVLSGGVHQATQQSFIKLSNTPAGRCVGLMTMVNRER